MAQTILKKGVSKNRFWSIMMFIFIYLVVLFFQCEEVAFTNEFGGHPDEAAHYVTGLMVSDYLSSVFNNAQDPLTYAKNYYYHYPKVAFGHWPPVFYIMQGGWSFIFGSSRISILLLIGLMTSLLGFTIYKTICKFIDQKIAMVAGIAFISLPLVRQYSGMVMAEIPLSLLSFLAVLFFFQYLEKEKTRDALLFSLFSIGAILTKGNALALALLPPLAIAFSGHFHVVKLPGFWVSGLLVAVICGPIYYLTFSLAQDTWAGSSSSFAYALECLERYPESLFRTLGYFLSIFSLLGFALAFIGPLIKYKIDAFWATIGAYAIGVFVFHMIVPSSIEARNMIMLLPALILFAAFGILSLIKFLNSMRTSKHGKGVIIIFIGILIFGEAYGKNYTTRFSGFKSVSNQIVNHSFANDIKRAVLIVSDSSGEGMFIADMAMKGEKFGHVVLRGSKVLAESDWIGKNYRSLYHDPDEVMAYLYGIPVSFIVVDHSYHQERDSLHFVVLKKMLVQNPGIWKRIGRYNMIRRGVEYPDSIELYIINDNEKIKKKIDEQQFGIGADDLLKKYNNFLRIVEKFLAI